MKRIRHLVACVSRAPAAWGAAIAIAAATVPSTLHAVQARRISTGISPVFYFFDGSYWGIGSGYGADLVVRCEIFNNLFLENRLGGYGGSQGDTEITGVNGQLGIVHFFPYWIPNRPSFRAALALMTVNPVVSDPIETFRPSQTVLYFVTGAGITWSLREYFQVEIGIDLMVTPYRYRVYHFYRQYVESREERFMHATLTFGASYTF